MMAKISVKMPRSAT